MRRKRERKRERVCTYVSIAKQTHMRSLSQKTEGLSKTQQQNFKMFFFFFSYLECPANNRKKDMSQVGKAIYTLVLVKHMHTF